MQDAKDRKAELTKLRCGLARFVHDRAHGHIAHDTPHLVPIVRGELGYWLVISV